MPLGDHRFGLWTFWRSPVWLIIAVIICSKVSFLNILFHLATKKDKTIKDVKPSHSCCQDWAKPTTAFTTFCLELSLMQIIQWNYSDSHVFVYKIKAKLNLLHFRHFHFQLSFPSEITQIHIFWQEFEANQIQPDWFKVQTILLSVKI